MPDAASPFRIAVAAMRVADDVAQNVAHMTARIAQAAEAGAALVCFPEYSLRPLNADWMDLTGAVETVRAACQAHGIWAVFGGESGGADARRNSLFLAGPDGEIRHRYDKVNLWGHEAEIFLPGTGAQVVQVGPLRLGMLTCWDIAFPRNVAALAEQGADLIVCSSCLVDFELDAEPLLALPLVRAFENLVLFVMCDVVSQKTLSTSMICHPLGVRQSIRGAEGLMVQEIDLADLARLRAYYASPAAEGRP